MPTPLDVRIKCVEAKKSGMLPRTIYNTIYCEMVSNPIQFNSFRTELLRWSKKIHPDTTTIEQGTYDGFIAHDATVQVRSNGEIVQAWIKQTANNFDADDFLEAISTKVEPYLPKPKKTESSENMLEIPLFDMHWGIAFMDHYSQTLDEILQIISSHRWKKIVIPFGQDFFHNDSVVNGTTTKGTKIEKVDMMRAVKEGQQFIFAIMDTAIEYADEVKMVYSPGNHDRSISWMFMQVLLAKYGEDLVDDGMEFRRVFTFGKNSIMVTHGDAKMATTKNLAHIFPISFPEEFASSTTREVHAGHIHHETDTDVFGVMVRHLSSGNITDKWSDLECFVGSHKRFMLFEWSPEKLKAIHYI